MADAVQHFAHYLTTVSGAQLDMLTTIHVKWVGRTFGNRIRLKWQAIIMTEGLQEMVFHEINSRAGVKVTA